MKTKLRRALCCVLTICGLTACGAPAAEPTPLPVSESASENTLRAAVLYDNAADADTWRDTVSRMAQPLLFGLACEAVDISSDYDLSRYDIIYPDESIMHSEKAEALREDVRSFAEAGGGVFLTNGFRDFFGLDFIGAKRLTSLAAYPAELTLPEVGDDLGELSAIVSDFHTLYGAYASEAELAQMEHGALLIPSSAVTIVKYGAGALCAMNRFGAGYVFYAPAFLPNAFTISGTELIMRDERQTSLSDTAMGAARILENSFASYISKQRWGYSIWRVFGSFGRPTMSWELHFEEITGFENGSGIAFGELCKEYSQVPGYTLVRSTYKWFLRAESITYLLGGGETPYSYEMDYEESAYSSGAHVAAGGKWLSIGEIAQGGSYFVDYLEQDYRAYPCIYDLDRDGRLDILSGSYDGKLRFYKGSGYSDRLHTDEGRILTSGTGAELSVPGYSAPVLWDWDGDGLVDIVVGAADGNIYWFRNNRDMTFAPVGLLLKTGLSGQALPAVDTRTGTLIVGSNEGRLIRFERNDEGFSEGVDISLDSVDGSWLSPALSDLNGDGNIDLAIGTFDGYVARYLSDGEGGYVFDGYFEGAERNYKGNDHLKFGNYVSPVFSDINGDGLVDIICGSLEYGMAYPIDSPYNPGARGLWMSVDYIKQNGFYLGMHFYTNQYASPEREEYELAAHKRAMAAYGIDISRAGANQHTWYTSTLDTRQSFLSLWMAGLLWNSGYTPANNSSNYPQASAQNVIALPFYMTVDGVRTILLQNCSTLLYTDALWTDISAKYDMPMNMYYHCDFTATDPETARVNLQTAENFRRAHDYSFCMENQLMYAVAAAYNAEVSVTGAGGEGLDMTLESAAASDVSAMYDERYQSCVGARLSVGERLADKALVTDANVWYRQGSDLYISLDKPVRVWEGTEQTGAHIIGVNVPASITSTVGGAEIAFTEGGMMQVTVFGDAATQSEGWTVEQYDGKTRFTKYGGADTLKIDYREQG